MKRPGRCRAFLHVFRLLLFLKHAGGPRLDHRLCAVGETGQQPWQHDLNPHMIFGDIYRSARLLLERGHAECETVATPDLFVHLKKLGVLRAYTAKAGLQPSGCFVLPELMRNGNDKG